MKPSHRHRVVVIGAGFGGLATVRAMRDTAVDVVLIDANNFHTFSPLLYQVATAGLAADDIAYAVRGVFRRQRNVEVRMARVTAIDIDAHEVRTNVGAPISYDTLVIAAGAVTHTFGVRGADEHALMMKTLDDAVALRDHVLRRFEAAAADPALIAEGALNVVVCGGGPTGVELAGALMELFDRVLAKDFPRLDVHASRVVLVEAADRLLGAFKPASGERARRTLAKRRVEIVTGVGVSEIDATSVTLNNGTRIPAHTVIWAAGVRANPLAEIAGLPTGRGGRIVIDDALATPTHPEVFAIGDIAANPQNPLPQVALPAIQQGKHVAAQIGHRLHDEPLTAFHFHDLGSMATIGRLDAIAEFPGGLRLAGPFGWIAWLGLHLIRLMGFRNRANVFVSWAWNYLTYDRGSRLLAESE